ncbi:MAG: NAD(P)/FAD-dependent oxidoreductase [Prevotellaceae bacterium]|nr:NAD(P)/FAD-dependent oxidoreductase [Prevotellaceae bacterium]
MKELPIENMPGKGNRKRVVVIGGGFAGLNVVKGLDKRLFQIVLIDRHNYHQFQPLYYQVATSGLEPSSIGFAFRKTLRKMGEIHFRMCTALSVDTNVNRLETSIGYIDYDYLIIASGTYTNYMGNKDLEHCTMSLKTLPESINVRNNVLRSFEKAINSHSEAEAESLLSFVIVGGGPTGVELAGALSELRRYTLPKDYNQDKSLSQMKIYLLDTAPRLLGGMSEFSSKKAYKYLQEMGVEIMLNTMVKGYTDGKIELNDGRSIASCNVFWVAGVAGRIFPGLDNDVYGRNNRIKVDGCNRVENSSNLFAIGDVCLMTSDPAYPHGHPQVAQAAIQQGKNLVHNLNKGDQKPFRYTDRGSMATVGRNKAVVEFRKIHFGGFVAWILWLFVHLMAIVGVKNKTFVLLNWGWSYFTHDTSLRLLIRMDNKNADK